MQKPIMIKYLFAISLCLSCLLFAGQAEARLTLGAVPAGGQAEGALTVDKINAIAASIAGSLGEEVTVKELENSDSLVNWLDRFATLDLALFTARDLVDFQGRFLMVGPLDAKGSLNLVARQGAPGDLPGRLAGFVSETGFVPGRQLTQTVTSEEPSVAPPVVEAPRQAVTQAKSIQQEAPQEKPPVSQGRAWTPEDGRSLRDILPADKPQTQKLVLGVVPDPTGIVNTGAQAELLADYLEKALPVDVTVREFEQIETFSAWFMRYRMVDIAVLSSDLAAINLGRDYLPIIKFFRSDKPGEASAELMVMRRGQDEDLQALLQQALLDVPKMNEGKKLMAALKVSELFVPGMRPSQGEVAGQEQEPADDMETGQVVEEQALSVPEIEPERVYPPATEILPPAVVPAPEPPQIVQVVEPETAPSEPDTPEAIPVPEKPVGEAIEPPVETVEDVIAGTLMETPEPEAPAPTQPVSPAEVPVIQLPEVAKVAEPSPLPPGPVLPEATLALPVPEATPVEPVQPISIDPVETPTPVIAKVEPVSPVMPVPPIIVAPEPVAVEVPPEDVISTGSVSPVEEPEVETTVETPQELVAPASPVVTAEMPTVVETERESPSVPPVEPSSEDPSIIEEVLTFADPVPTHELDKQIYMVPVEDPEQVAEDDLLAMLGEDPVAAMVAQPNLPQELRPTGVPVVRPRPTPQKTAAAVEDLLVASIPEPMRQVEPEKPPVLLPQPDPEPGIVYVVPFVSIMVPGEVSSRIFDQFIDALNEQGEALDLQFVILKEGLQRVAPEWLAIRKYVTGELYAYVEDSGCCSTDLRSKARLTYRHPHKQEPVFGFEYPVRNFFDHDRSTLEVERSKLADDVATTLADELIKALQN